MLKLYRLALEPTEYKLTPQLGSEKQMKEINWFIKELVNFEHHLSLCIFQTAKNIHQNRPTSHQISKIWQTLLDALILNLLPRNFEILSQDTLI